MLVVAALTVAAVIPILVATASDLGSALSIWRA
jgi:hypothetical protein